MKNEALLLLVPAVLAAGCSKESITEDPWTGYSQNQNGSGSTSGVTGNTTAEALFDEEDLVANTKFDLTVSVVFSENGDAVVSGTNGQKVTINGNQVTIDNRNVTDAEGKGIKVKYELSGKTGNGFLKLYSNNKQALVLNGVSITNPNGAAINNQGKKRCFVIVNGSNSLADGASYTATPEDEDEKAVFFSEGQLIFSGEGSLDITAKGKAGITSDDYLHFMENPSISVNASAGHGFRGKDFIYVSGGTLEATVSASGKKGMSSDSLVVFNGGTTTLKISGGVLVEDGEYTGSAGVRADQLFVMNVGTLDISNSGQGGKGISCDGPGFFQGGDVTVNVSGSNYGSSSSQGGFGPGASTSSDDSSKSAKGLKFDGNLYFSGGTVVVKATNHEAIESKGKIEINGGNVYAQSKDDAINSSAMMAITGGHVVAWSTGNDGLDANGNLYIEGGVVYAIGSGGAEVAVDANTEGGACLYMNGGILFSIGGLERGAAISQTCYQASSWNKNTWYSLEADGKTYAFQTPSSGGTGLVVSAPSQPDVKSGVTVNSDDFLGDRLMLSGEVSGGSAVSLSAYSASSGGMGGPGGPGGRPW